jgi:GT2 family glycosyltransferase
VSSEPLPRVTVVIPHRGNDDVLEKCIVALRNQTFPKDRIEILVVVNEEAERSLAFPLEAGEKLLWQPTHYSYAARNLGILHATGDIIALTDSDTIPSTQWLEEGMKALHDNVDLVAGHIELTFAHHPLTPAACYEKLFAFDQEKNVALGRATTANLFATRASLRRFGLFTKTAQSGEDFRWTTHATRAGALLRFAPLAVVTHPARESMSELLDKAHRVTANFPRSHSRLGTLGSAIKRYWTLYVLPPSRSKRRSCTLREGTVAYVTAPAVQLAKAVSFLKALIMARARSRQGRNSGIWA